MQIIFNIFGNGYHSWASDYERINYSDLLKDIEQNSEIGGENLDVAYNEVENQGIIFVGEYVAGSFLICTLAGRGCEGSAVLAMKSEY
ncbi:MAG: hypothetical protein JW795_16955 [Chitinivibrionales bacterium]|nr:hypothetical protein [Chitinivibrionales bacterium]